MTTPIHEPGTPDSQPKAESFLDWFHVNSRLVTVAAVALGIGLAGVWFVKAQNVREAANADKKLLAAKQALGTGNVALAESDLKKVADQYGSKPAGAEAGMLLAQLQLEKGDVNGALATLKTLNDKAKSGPAAAQARALMGDALTQGGKAAEAAAEYEAAAGLTSMANEKAYFQAKAARAFQAAGKGPEAKRLWEVLAAQTDNDALTTEARVRIGEITAGSSM